MKRKTTDEIRELMFKAADSCKPIKRRLPIKLSEDEITIIEKAILMYVANTPHAPDNKQANKLHDRFYKFRQDLDLL